MKSKSQRLSLVADIAGRKEAKALEQMQQAKTYLDQQQAQLHSLQEYRQQYIEQYKTQQSRVNQVQQLLAYQKFIAQLDGAIEQQNNLCEQATLAFEHTRKIWLELSEKRKSMESLEQHYAELERVEREKKDEKRMMDDFTAARARRK